MTDHVSDADTYAAIAKRLGWEYHPTPGYPATTRLVRMDMHTIHTPCDAWAIIRDRAAEVLRKRGYNVTGPFSISSPWFVKDIGSVASYSKALDATDYPTALLAALTLAGIGGDDGTL